jgi:hypothetical protein
MALGFIKTHMHTHSLAHGRYLSYVLSLTNTLGWRSGRFMRPMKPKIKGKFYDVFYFAGKLQLVPLGSRYV